MARKVGRGFGEITVEERLQNLRNESKKSHNKRRRKNIASRIKNTEQYIKERNRKRKNKKSEE